MKLRTILLSFQNRCWWNCATLTEHRGERSFPRTQCHTVLVLIAVLQRAASEALVQHLPGPLRGRPDPAPQDAGPQGEGRRAVSKPRAGKEGVQGVEGQGQSLHGHKTEVWVLSKSVRFLLWASVSPSVECGQGTILPCHSAMGPVGLLLVVILSPVSLCYRRPSHLGASGTGEGRVCPCSGPGAECSQMIADAVACRREAKPQWALPGCTWDTALCPRGLPSFP